MRIVVINGHLKLILKLAISHHDSLETMNGCQLAIMIEKEK